MGHQGWRRGFGCAHHLAGIARLRDVNIRQMPMPFGDTAVLITAFQLIGKPHRCSYHRGGIWPSEFLLVQFKSDFDSWEIVRARSISAALL
jgi:hypothetical protein